MCPLNLGWVQTYHVLFEMCAHEIMLGLRCLMCCGMSCFTTLARLCLRLQNPATRNRARDHLIAAGFYSQMLYQLSYSRLGASDWQMQFEGIWQRFVTEMMQMRAVCLHAYMQPRMCPLAVCPCSACNRITLLAVRFEPTRSCYLQ